MRPKKYIVWSKNEIDLNDSWQRRWYIQQVLNYGRAKDIVLLNWEEVKTLLGQMHLSSEVKRLWEAYFSNA